MHGEDFEDNDLGGLAHTLWIGRCVVHPARAPATVADKLSAHTLRVDDLAPVAEFKRPERFFAMWKGR